MNGLSQIVHVTIPEAEAKFLHCLLQNWDGNAVSRTSMTDTCDAHPSSVRAGDKHCYDPTIPVRSPEARLMTLMICSA